MFQHIESIRSKIFLGCLCLALLTILVGVVSRIELNQLSTTALGIYDNAFIPMSYLRSAQTIVLDVSLNFPSEEAPHAVSIDQLQSAIDALDVADERAMSPQGAQLANQLKASVLSLQEQISDEVKTLTPQQFAEVERLFDSAVEIYAADGFRLRRSVEAEVYQKRIQTCGAIVAAIIAALLITLLLSDAIVPSIRHAVTIATAIADGHLDNHIDRRCTGETGLLLRALSMMQSNIAEKIGRIETLMAHQASSHAAQSALQHTRFEAALNNMTIGLCMFDARDEIVVQNKRFTEMFLSEMTCGDIRTHLTALGLICPPNSTGVGQSFSFNCHLDDGRVIAVAQEGMSGGGRVLTLDDVTDRHHAEERLSAMARHDALTGLPNRIMFREHLEQKILDVGHCGLVSVLCLDLDRFKTVNDTLGHPVGDALLQEAAFRLKHTINANDLVARLGGDEFAIIHLVEDKCNSAELLANRLIQTLCLPYKIDIHHIAIGVSIGIAETGAEQMTSDDLLKSADLALYLAKAEGGNIYRRFEQSMDDQIQARRRLELDLRVAMVEQQFEVHYQPIVSACGNLVAFEALLRWRHVDRGMVSPAEFIPLAEETGLIRELGLWVLNQACMDAMKWPTTVKVAVNLSPLQFCSPNLVGDITSALRIAGMPANRLEIEITESLMLQDKSLIHETLHQLHAIGISISMDDFGTGYSSLSYLRRFPFDKIKIDQSFIRNIGDSSDGMAIVKAVIGLGQLLRMTVVAEGVETREQLESLRMAGCHQMQGFLFSGAKPAWAVVELIDRLRSVQASLCCVHGLGYSDSARHVCLNAGDGCLDVSECM